MIDLPIKEVEIDSASSFGILASPTTIATNLYTNIAGLRMLSDDQQKQTAQLIHKVISGKLDNKQILKTQIQLLRKSGCEKIILGCIKLSVINAVQQLNYVIEPLDVVCNEIM